MFHKIGPATKRENASAPYEEEDTCISYEEEDTCMWSGDKAREEKTNAFFLNTNALKL
jgi:hypothetical protein